MDSALTATRELRLAHRAIYSLPDAAGIEIRCGEGCLWVTLDGDPRDLVIEAGETFRTPQHRRAVVYALEPSRIEVSPPAPAGRKVPRRGLQIESVPRITHA
jgi:hypothetical protein